MMPLSEMGCFQRSHFTLFLMHHPTAASIFTPSSFNKRYTFPIESMNGQVRNDLIGSLLCKHSYHASALAEDAVPYRLSPNLNAVAQVGFVVKNAMDNH